MKILVFGDSIAVGKFDTKTGGWANQLAIYYQKQALANLGGEETELLNLGVSGDTAERVLTRLASEVSTRRLRSEEDCIVIAIGINDAALRRNRVVSDVHDFQATYDKIISEALKLTPRVVCVGLTAVKESESDPWAYSRSDEQWKNNRINLYEDTIKQSASNLEVPFVPLHDEFLRQLSDKKMLADGLHPSTAGHAFIAKAVLSTIEAIR